MNKSYTVVLLDTTKQVRKSIIKFLKTMKNFKVFDDVDVCVDYITDIKEHKIYFIVNESDAHLVDPILDDLPQLDSI
jgi:hypothetical protein